MLVTVSTRMAAIALALVVTVSGRNLPPAERNSAAAVAPRRVGNRQFSRLGSVGSRHAHNMHGMYAYATMLAAQPQPPGPHAMMVGGVQVVQVNHESLERQLRLAALST